MTRTQQESKATPVLGGTGKTGCRVVERLTARDAAATGIWKPTARAA